MQSCAQSPLNFSWTYTRFVGRITWPFAPIQSSRAVPTDQAEIVRDDQLELQEHCNNEHAVATSVDDGRGLCSPRAVVDGLQDLSLTRWTNHIAVRHHPVASSLCRRARPRSSDLTSLRSQGHCNADQIAATCVDDGQGRGCSALRSVVSGNQLDTPKDGISIAI